MKKVSYASTIGNLMMLKIVLVPILLLLLML